MTASLYQSTSSAEPASVAAIAATGRSITYLLSKIIEVPLGARAVADGEDVAHAGRELDVVAAPVPHEPGVGQQIVNFIRYIGRQVQARRTDIDPAALPVVRV